MPYRFDFAISFSRECRELAEGLTELLVAQGAKVFYDNAYLHHLLGKHLDDELGWAFGSATRFFVPIVSAGYTRRTWPQYEWSIAKLEADRRQEEFILPLRVDDSLLVGLLDTTGNLDFRNFSLEEVADILLRKLEKKVSTPCTTSHEQEWIVTFGINLQDIKLPNEAPERLPLLYDWLIEDLVTRLAQSEQQYTEIMEDSRTGETLSVRLRFTWHPDKGPLNFGEMCWWELLELLPYHEVYRNSFC